MFGIQILNKKQLDNIAKYHRSDERQRILNLLPPAHRNSNIPQELTNPNICDKCKKPEVDYTFYDTGICGQCQDPELVALYAGLGFEGECVWANLPRLRSGWFDRSEKPLTMENIGREIVKHISYIKQAK